MRVKIKTWGKMEKEFGLDADGGIACEYSFNCFMEEKMPEGRVIEVDEFGFLEHWEISDDMIEEVLQDGN